MPRANTTESFFWRAAPQPDRARLVGAIAIALSCAVLGVLVGRWSVARPPTEAGTRTEALIEAVARETQAKATAAARAAEIAASQTRRGAEDGAREPSSPANIASRLNSAVAPERSSDPAPTRASVPPPNASAARSADTSADSATPPAGSDQAPDRQRPATSTPLARELRRPQLRPAPQENAAPNYRALRDYVLSR
jgi:hypothetical protein